MQLNQLQRQMILQHHVQLDQRLKSVLFWCNKPNQLVSQIIQQQKLSHDLLKQVALMNKKSSLIKTNGNTDGH